MSALIPKNIFLSGIFPSLSGIILEYPVFTGLTKTISATSIIEFGFALNPYGCIGFPSSSILSILGPV